VKVSLLSADTTATAIKGFDDTGAEGSADDDWDGEASGNDEAEHCPGTDTEDQQACRSGRGGGCSRGSLNNKYALVWQGTDEAASTMEVRKHTHRVSRMKLCYKTRTTSADGTVIEMFMCRCAHARLGNGSASTWSGAERRA